jgi:hypothetical protein
MTRNSRTRTWTARLAKAGVVAGVFAAPLAPTAAQAIEAGRATINAATTAHFSGPGAAFGSADYRTFQFDPIVNDILAGNAPLYKQIEETIGWVYEDPSRGWVGDYPATNPVLGDLAPVLGEVGEFGSIMGQVLENPYAELTPEQEAYLLDQMSKDGYWNFVWGGVADGREMQERAIQEQRDWLEAQRRWNLEYETWELMNDIAGVLEGAPGVVGEYSPTYPVLPWPGY